jgi:arsenate reductase (thioredoxin)
MTSTILFLCPHHAAKSVIAEVYFNRLAQQHHLPIAADSAGTEPDEVVSPIVAKMLKEEGIDVSQHRPRFVTQTDLEQAQRVISMGCALDDLAIEPERVEQWLDIPALSQDLYAGRNAILAHIEALIAELSTPSPSPSV